MMNEVALNLMNSWLEDDNNITDEGLLLISLFTVADVNNGGKTVLELDELVESIIYTQDLDEDDIEDLLDLTVCESSVRLIKIVLADNNIFRKMIALYRLMQLTTIKEIRN